MSGSSCNYLFFGLFLGSLLSLSIYWHPQGRMGYTVQYSKVIYKGNKENETMKRKITWTACSQKLYNRLRKPLVWKPFSMKMQGATYCTMNLIEHKGTMPREFILYLFLNNSTWVAKNQVTAVFKFAEPAQQIKHSPVFIEHWESDSACSFHAMSLIRWFPVLWSRSRLEPDFLAGAGARAGAGEKAPAPGCCCLAQGYCGSKVATP